MKNFKLDIVSLPDEVLKAINNKFTGCLGVHQETNSYYIWFKKGNFIGAYPSNFDLLNRLIELQVLSAGKVRTIKASRKKNETIALLLNRLDLILEDCNIQEVLQAIFEEQITLAAEVMTYRDGVAALIEEEEDKLPQDNLTDLSQPGLEFFLTVMRRGEKELASSYKDLAPASVYSLRKIFTEETERILPFLDAKERAVYKYADGTTSIRAIADKCGVRSQKIKLIYIRLHLLKLLDTSVSPDLKDKLISKIGLQRVESDLNISPNNKHVWWGAGLLAGTLLFLNLARAFQGLELSLFDRFSRWRKLAYGRNQDITLVTFDDSDIQKMGRWPLTDADLVKVLNNIENYEPTVIGLDVIRDIPVAPGTEQLSRFYQNTDTLVSIAKIVPPKSEAPAIPKQKGNVASIDLVLDPDGKLRRFPVALWEGEKKYRTLGVETALRHINRTGGEIVYPGNLNNPSQERLGDDDDDDKVVNPVPLHLFRSGYRWADLGGAQILGNFTHTIEDFDTISLTDVYRGQFDPKLIKGRAIIIGSTAESLKDYFNTPLSSRIWGSKPMSGLVVHANVASTFIYSSRKELSPLEPVNLGNEMLLLLSLYLLGMGGGWVVIWYSHEDYPLPSWAMGGIIVIGGTILLLGAGFWLFFSGTWIPVFSMSLFYSAGFLYYGSQLQNHTKNMLYTTKSGIKNRKYLLRYLQKHNGDYALIGTYLQLNELDLNRQEKCDILKNIEANLIKHLPLKCEITQISGNCLVLVSDVTALDAVKSVCDRVDKILLEMNIGDDKELLKYQITSINSASMPNPEPETVLASVLKSLS